MKLNSWKQLVYETIKANFHVKEKIRQILQRLRDDGLVQFVDNQGTYVLNVTTKVDVIKQENEDHYVYLLSNQSIPDWVKIGQTNNIERRLKELYNTSIPTPFKLEETILTPTKEKVVIVESTIHTLIDTLNPSLRKETEAYRREFFKLSPDKTKEVVIPEIQRPFVWKVKQVRDLIDSLYKGFPVGYLIVSRSHEMKFKDGSLSKGQRILIDGQQRVDRRNDGSKKFIEAVSRMCK